MIDSALKYVSDRLPVLPLCWPDDGACGCGRNHKDKSIGKVPLLENGLTEAAVSETKVKEYWGRWPSANIGIAIPPGLFVLDVDISHNGFESLGLLQESIGELPQTWLITTGGGGQHYYYKTSKTIRNTTKLGGYEGLDIRGIGGYVVAPPSWHKSGERYEVSKWNGGITLAPESLIELCLSRPTVELTGDGQPIAEGSRNDTLTRDAGAMRRRGLSEGAIYAALQITSQERCQPPLDDEEIRIIAKSVTRYPPTPETFNKSHFFKKYKTYI